MSFYPSKKRALEDVAAASSSLVPPPMSRLTHNSSSTRTMTTMTTLATTKTPDEGSSLAVAVLARNPSSSGTSSSSFPLLCLQHQVESLQAELEHEQSLHLLDQKRADQARQRLEKQLAIAVEEAQQATQTLQDFTRESHKMTDQLRQARNKTLDELRTCQLQLLSLQNGDGDGNGNDDSAMVKFWEEKCSYLEEELANQQENEQQLRLEMQEIQRNIEEKIQAQRAENKEAVEAKATVLHNNKIMEEAPLAVLQELNSVRLELADTKRRERQALRRVEDLQQRNTSLIQEREQALLASQRLPVVEQELTRLRREYETLLAQHAAWKQFEQELLEATTTLHTMQLPPSNSSSGSATSSTTTPAAQRARKSSTTGPPEVSTIERYLREAKNRVTEMERQKKTLQDECQQLRQANLPLQKALQELQQKEREWSRERRQMQAQVETSCRNLQQAETQQAIYQREALELQNLIKACDNLPFATTTTTTTPGTSVFAFSSPKGDNNSIKTLELTLSTKRQELDLALQEKERLNKEKGELLQELETVKGKFGKLRDALLVERNKAQEAEQRANAAEALAGKGSFDPETTRVLHLTETPLTQTLKEEIQVLQRQLEVAKNTAAAMNSSKGNNSSSNKSLSNSASKSISVDAEKLNKRLKENFKEQIALFREGVYLMTGFKVEMLSGTDRPTFRVRSVYAEKEEDHLLLKWPKPSTSSSSGAAAAADTVQSLDVLNTDFARNLTTTSSYEYMTKFSSLPAFLAAVQLNLFEKQTVMIS